ncbi:MAG: hypothetical protein JWO78_625 [Micavibrio sp.]|nr:hypothetical protein [Micavibrio sp.]
MKSSSLKALHFLAVLAGTILLTQPALAKSAKAPVAGNNVQKMNYEVYAGGINAVDSELNITLQGKDRYSFEMFAATKGFLKVLAPWSGSFETHGWQLKDKDQPELHRSVATWRGDDEIKNYSYAKDGKFVAYSIKDDENDGSKKPVDPELTENTTDALTAVLAVMRQVGEGKACAGSSEVFDGDRRYKMTFVSKGTEDLKATKYNVYEGPAEKCTVEVAPAGGKWHEKPRGWLSIQEQGRQHGQLPTVWFARMQATGPAVPVKIMIKSDYGAMFMHLAGYSNGTESLSAEVRGETKSERAGATRIGDNVVKKTSDNGSAPKAETSQNSKGTQGGNNE